MIHEQAPTEKPYEKSEGERRGLIIVNTGDGKGKSTAAFGLALRAHGRGKAVKIFQFMKVPTARFGEHRMFEQLGIPIEGLGDGFSWKSRDLEHSAQLARDGWQNAKSAILSGDYFMVTLDEITYPLIYGWMKLKDVLGVYVHGLFEDAAAVQALFGAGRAQPVPTLDSVFDGLADYVQAHFEPGVLDELLC